MALKSLLGGASILMALCSPVSAGMHRRTYLRTRSSDPAMPTVPTYNISMPLDHFNSSDSRVFDDRFYVNDQHYKPGGPVIYFDFGEAGLTEMTAAGFLVGGTNSTSSLATIAQRYNALLLAMEHRYYGKSLPLPFNLTSGLPIAGPSAYDYLTVDQALEDVVYLANNLKLPNKTDEQLAALKPSRTPWIWIGGSYSGARAAWSRARSPETWYAAWASSAPVNALVDGSSYFDPVGKSLPSNCSTDVNTAMHYFDQVFSGTNSSVQQNLQILLCTALGYNGNSTCDLTTAMQISVTNLANNMGSQLVGNFQEYGPSQTTDILCDFLDSYNPRDVPANASVTDIIYNPGNRSSDAKPLSSTYDAATVMDAFVFALYQSGQANNQNSDDSDNDFNADTTSWAWQVTHQVGFYEAWSEKYARVEGNHSILTKFFNLSDYAVQEKQLFNYSDSAFPSEPKTADVLKYGGWNMTPSNTMFTVGQFDPWRSFSVLSEDKGIGAPGRQPVQTVPACNKPPAGSDVFGLVYPGAVHVQDLPGGAPGPMKEGPALFTQALDAWLPCFHANSTQS